MSDKPVDRDEVRGGRRSRPPGIGWSLVLLFIGVAIAIASAPARPFGIAICLLALAGIAVWWSLYRAHPSAWSPPTHRGRDE